MPIARFIRKKSHNQEQKNAVNSLVKNSKIESLKISLTNLLKNKKVYYLVHLLKNKYFLISIISLFLLISIFALFFYLSSNKEEAINDYDFTKGVLALNTDKSSYIPGDAVIFQMSSLNSKGDTLCNSKLQLQITVPGEKNKVILNYDKKQIVTTSTCKPDNNVTNDPDYLSRYTVSKTGEYSVLLINLDTGKKVKSNFKVNSNNPQFIISRNSATRINPFKSDRYPMSISIKSDKDFKGTYIEYLPKNFEFKWIGGAEIKESATQKIVSWQVDLKAGEPKIIGYDYTAPKKSPDFIRYGIGELVVNNNVVFKETNAWQIASDASCISNGTGNWTTITWTNCASGPTSADTARISNNNTVTLNTSPTVVSLTIDSGATLTNDANARTITVTNAAGIPLTNNGTFTPGTSITVSVNSAGSTLILSGSWTGANAFYDLTFAPTMGGAYTYTMNAAFTVNRNWLSNPSSSSARDLTVNLSGATIVTGTLTLSGTGCTTADTTAATTQFSTNGQSLSVGKVVVNGVTSGDNCQFITANSSTVTFTGTTGILFTLGTTGSTSRMTTGTTTTWEVTSASGTPYMFFTTGTAIVVHILKINADATVINAGANFTIDTNAGSKLWIAKGVFNQENRTITNSSAGTLQVDNTGTLCLGGATGSTTADCLSGAAQTTAQAMPTFATYTFSSGSTVRYLSDAATTVSRIGGANYGNLELKPKFVTTSRTYTFAAGTANIMGNLIINPDESGAGTPALTVNLGGVTTVDAADTTTITATNSATSSINQVANTNTLSTGKIDIGAAGTLTMITSGSLELTATSGTLFTKHASGTFTYATSTVNITSASGPVQLFSSAFTLYNLTINSASSSTVVNSGATPTFATNGSLTVTTGVLNFDTGVTGPGASGTLTLGATGKLCLGGTAAATNTSTLCNTGATSASLVTMPTFQNYSFNASSTVIYLSNTDDTGIFRGATYGNLDFRPELTANRAYTFSAGAVTVAGNLAIVPGGSANSLTVNLNGGGITVTSATAINADDSATSTLNQVANTNTITTGTMTISTPGTLTMITTGTLTLTGTTGNLFNKFASGTFNYATSTINVTSASGTPQLFVNATTVYNLTINSAATVINLGATPTFATNGSLTVTSGVLNADVAITGPGASGTLTLGASGTLCLGGTLAATNTSATCNTGITSTSAITLPTFNTYTFNATSSVRYLSDADLTLVAAPTYGNVYFTPKLTASRAYTLVTGTTAINGNLTIDPTASSTTKTLTVNMKGALTVASTKTTTIQGTTTGASKLMLRVSSTDYNLSSGLIALNSGGTLDGTSTVTSTITLTGNTGSLFSIAGTGAFIAGGTNTIFNGTGGTPTLTSGTFTSTNAFNTFTLSPNISSPTIYNFGTSAIEVNGDLNIQPAGSALLTVNMQGAITVANNKTLSINRSNTASSKLVTGAINPTLSAGNINVAVASVTTLDGTGSTSVITLTANGTPFAVTGTFTPGSTTISYIPASTTGVNVGSTTYYNVIFNKASNTFSLQSSGITVTNDLTITAGVLDVVSGSNFPITVGRNWTNTPGTGGFLPQQGTVTFNTTTTATVSGATNFYNFTAATAGKTIKFANSTTFTTSGLLTLTGSASGPSYVTLDSVNGSPDWTINHQGTESITYATIKNSACDGTSTNINAYTTAGNVDGTGNGACWIFEAPAVASTFYKFDEGYGTTAYDASGLGNSGTLAGATKPTWQNEDLCVSGKCLYFNGTTATVTAGSVSVKTVSFWAKPNSLTNTFLQLSATKYISSNSSGVISANGYSNSIIYVNGVPKTTIEANKWQLITVTTSIDISATAIIIGNNSTNYYQGFMDEVKFNNTEFTAAQVKGDFTKNGNVDPVSASFGPDNSWVSNGLIGYWKMDESSSDISDSSGLGNTLTNNGTTTFVTGKFGNGSEYVPASTQYFSLSSSTVASYYLNASDSGPTDTPNYWASDTNAFDSTPSTVAITNVDSATIVAGGTNAPTSGGTITQVRGRVYGCVDADFSTNLLTAGFSYSVGLGDATSTADCGASGWSSYATLSTPSGGWTWQKVNDLTVTTYVNGTNIVGGEFGQAEVEVTSGGSGSLPSTQSVSFWTNPDSTTNYYVSLTSGAYITSTSGTLSATGLNNAKIYVNGVESSTIVANQWQHVVVTFDSITPDQFYVGRQGTNYYDGTMDEVRLYNRVLSPDEVSKLYLKAPGPIAYWNLDENTGTDVHDSSGNGNNSSAFSGNTAWGTGKYGSALSFDGAGDSVTIPDNDIFSSQNFTASAWVQNLQSVSTDQGEVVAKGYHGDGEFSIRVSQDNLYCDINGNNTNGFESAGEGVGPNWTHVACSYDGSNIRFYINGVLKQTTALSTTIPNSGYDITIGIDDTGGFAHLGNIDDVKIYNYARTSSQIIEDMNGGHPIGGSPVGSQVAFYKFDEASNTTAYDASPNANNLTLSTTSWNTSGKSGSAWNGDGVTYLSRADDADFDIPASGNFAVSTWFKSDSTTNPSSNEYIYNKSYSGGAQAAGHALYSKSDSSGKVCFGIDDDTTWSPDTEVCTTSDVYDTTWHQITAVRNTTLDTIAIYFDAIIQTSTADTTTATLENTKLLYVGDRNAANDGDELNGDLDNLRFYQTSLTDTQVKVEYSQGMSTMLGAYSTSATPSVVDNSAARSYCVPGDSTSCSPPIGEWRFDENTGTSSTADTSGNGTSANFNGTILASQWVPGKVGSALSFDGVDDYVQADNTTLYDMGTTTPFTISAWFRSTSAGTIQNILLAANNTSNFYRMQLNGGFLRAQLVDTGLSNFCTLRTQTAVDDGNWHFVSAQYNRNASCTTSDIIIYIDGFKVPTTVVTSTLNTNVNLDENAVRIGGNVSFFQGEIDNVRIYNYIRTPAQIAWDYTRGAPAAWFKFDECTGTTINDSMGNLAAGTLTLGGTPASGTCTRLGGTTGAWLNGSSGKIDAAMDFDATDDYVTVTNTNIIDADLGLSQGFSASAWVYADGAGEGTGGRIFTKNTNTWCRVDTLSGSDLDVQCSLDLSTDATLNISTAIKTGQWNHIVVTWSDDADDEISIYVNGLLKGTSTDGVGPVSADSANLIIGNDSTSGTATFDGKIDDFRLFSYELTPQQIKTIYNNGAASFK